MRVIEGTAKIEFTHQEMSDIAFDLKNALMFSAENHWLNFAKDKNATEFADYVLDKEVERVRKIHFLFGITSIRCDLRSDLVLLHKRKINNKE